MNGMSVFHFFRSSLLTLKKVIKKVKFRNFNGQTSKVLTKTYFFLRNTLKKNFKPLWRFSYKNIVLECDYIKEKNGKVNEWSSTVCTFYRENYATLENTKKKRCDEKTLKL